MVLDEATSALDTETEQAVVDASNVLAGAITTVVIAHRESTLRAYTRVLRLVEGRVILVSDSSKGCLEGASNSDAKGWRVAIVLVRSGLRI